MASAWIRIRCPWSPESKEYYSVSRSCVATCVASILMLRSGRCELLPKGAWGESSAEAQRKGEGILETMLTVHHPSVEPYPYKSTPTEFCSVGFAKHHARRTLNDGRRVIRESTSYQSIKEKGSEREEAANCSLLGQAKIGVPCVSLLTIANPEGGVGGRKERIVT